MGFLDQEAPGSLLPDVRKSTSIPARDHTILYQQGTYAPDDGVHRWMGSIAMDRRGNMALGYSVVNGSDVFPGIRYTGRMRKDPLGEMNSAPWQTRIASIRLPGCSEQ